MPSFSPDEREQIIQNANLSSICDPHTGDCVSVAVAIQEVFGGRFYCAYEEPPDSTLVHATVEIDDVLYDGTGITAFRALYENAIYSLENSDIQPPEEHLQYDTELHSHQLYKETIKNRVKERLEDSIDQFTN